MEYFEQPRHPTGAFWMETYYPNGVPEVKPKDDLRLDFTGRL
jgi:hypothetical protein